MLELNAHKFLLVFQWTVPLSLSLSLDLSLSHPSASKSVNASSVSSGTGTKSKCNFIYEKKVTEQRKPPAACITYSILQFARYFQVIFPNIIMKHFTFAQAHAAHINFHIEENQKRKFAIQLFCTVCNFFSFRVNVWVFFFFFFHPVASSFRKGNEQNFKRYKVLPFSVRKKSANKKSCSLFLCGAIASFSRNKFICNL